MQIAKRMQAITPFYVMELLRRAKQLESQGRDIIHMEIGEPALPTPELITQAGLEYVSRGQVKYTPAAGLYELTDVTHPNDISIKIVGYENT